MIALDGKRGCGPMRLRFDKAENLAKHLFASARAASFQHPAGVDGFAGNPQRQFGG